MKTVLLFITLIISVNLSAQSDTSNLIAYNSYTGSESWGSNSVPFLVGSHKLPGYEIETRVCSKDESITLPNGRVIAGLSCIILEKEDYVGGTMVFDNDTTAITDVSITPVGTGAIFTVTGKDFTMSFTLRTGIILRYESSYATFNTEDKGVWTINKKV